MRVSKFVVFEQFLENSKTDTIEMSFAEIEKVLGFALKPSAYEHVAYWYLSKTHTFPLSWINAGFRLVKIDLNAQKACFQRNDGEGKPQKFDSSRRQSEGYNTVENAETELYKAKTLELIEIIREDEHSRYLSWEHCYSKFSTVTNPTVEQIDYLSLHLAFYLASWGMYRGSSFLLQKDYKVHIDVVKEVFNPRYNSLRGISCRDLLIDENLKLLFELSESLKRIYLDKRKNYDGHDDVSAILITKVLLGTLGCTPAYDRFFVETLRTKRLASGTFNKDSIRALSNFYVQNSEMFDEVRIQINANSTVNYPEMKILDMCLWYIGFEKGPVTDVE